MSVRRTARYGGESIRVRAHVALRWWSCPFGAVLAEIPLGASVLDYGCGHGLLALEAAARRQATVLGVDIDRAKIEVARRSATPATRFAVIEPGQIPDGSWPAICVTDMLYLLEPSTRDALVARLAGRLTPGGVLIVKEMDSRPAVKAAWLRTQERIMVRVLRATLGESLAFTDAAGLDALLGSCGLDVTSHSVARHYPHPHHLVVGRAR